eukprot:tig00000073_g1724.t1
MSNAPRFDPKAAYGPSGAAIFSAPHKYIQKAGLIGEMAAFLRPLASRPDASAGVLIVPALRPAYEKRIIKSIEEAGARATMVDFGGECSWEEVNKLSAAFRQKTVDYLIVVGGGKCLDAGKVVASVLKVPSVIVPTLASNDAPCSALSVMYSPDGSFEEVLNFRDNPHLVLVDTAVIAEAPRRFLVSGMGDAMATFYEADACRRAPHARSEVGGRPTASAVALSALCRDILYEHGAQAAADVERKQVTDAVEKVVEANVLLSGLGFESAGLALAHALHNGLTWLPGTHGSLHGEKVAFCTLAQLCLEENEAEARRVARFFAAVGLPVTLNALGVDPADEAGLAGACERTVVAGATAHNMPGGATAESVLRAVKRAHQLGSEILAEVKRA